METVTISREEYEKMKKALKVDEEIVAKIKRSLEHIKVGKIKEWQDD
jgi:hypothetical protein